MPTFKNIDLEEPSTVTASVSAVEITRNSSLELQEIISIGDPESSLGVAAVLNAAPASTAWGLVVRPRPTSVTQGSTDWVTQCSTLGGRVLVDQNSTVWPVQVSTVSGRVLVDQNSTDWVTQVSSVAGQVAVVPITSSGLELTTNTTPASTAEGVIVRQVDYVAPSTIVTVSTGSVRVHQSSAGDLNVTVAGYVAPSTTVQVSSLAGQVTVVPITSSGLELTTNATPGSTAEGIIVRQAFTAIASTGFSTVGVTSTRSTLVSSVAAQAVKVFAYSITSTVVAVSACEFRSSDASLLWPVILGSGSSGITGANLAVSPPGYLFQTAAGEPLRFVVPSSGVAYHVAISYMVE